MAHFFADLFADRNVFGDVDTIITQFQAYRQPEPEGHHAKVACPAIILTGSEDNTHRTAFALQKRIAGCEMKILYGAGHACQIEQPALFNRYMIEFLTAHGLFPGAARRGLSFSPGEVASDDAHSCERRELLLGLAALPVASRIAVAETYPSRPVRILVATSAGGGTDLVARFIAQWLTERLGQSFFVENRPGGGNNIGTEMAARSPADGYTLFMANTVNTINNSLYQKLNYNFIADFAPVANVMGTPLLVLVHPSVAAKNAAELIALAKAAPASSTSPRAASARPATCPPSCSR